MLLSPGDTGKRELQVWPLGGGYCVRGVTAQGLWECRGVG